MFVFREGLQFRVFSLECLVVLFRQLLQMLSEPLLGVTRIPASHTQEFHIAVSVLN